MNQSNMFVGFSKEYSGIFWHFLAPTLVPNSAAVRLSKGQDKILWHFCVKYT